MSDEIIDRIYEAAFVPEKWPDVIDTIARGSESASGSVLVFSGQRAPRFRCSERTRQALHDFCTTEAWQKSERAPYMLDAMPATFICDADYLTPEQFDRDSVALSLRSLGLGWQLGSAIPMPERAMVSFTFEREVDRGRHSPEQLGILNGFRPHLARAGLIATRLGLERAQNAVATLESLGLPAFVLSAHGAVVALNPLGEALSSVIKPAAHGGLVVADRPTSDLLQLAIRSIGETGDAVRSIPLPAAPDRKPMILHLLPLRGLANDLFSNASMLLVVTSVTMTNRLLDGTVLDALFDLSPAEARIALSLGSGRTLKEAALDSGIQFSTARSYLESIFRKTATNRQSQLVALLKSTQPLILP